MADWLRGGRIGEMADCGRWQAGSAGGRRKGMAFRTEKWKGTGPVGFRGGGGERELVGRLSGRRGQRYRTAWRMAVGKKTGR